MVRVIHARCKKHEKNINLPSHYYIIVIITAFTQNVINEYYKTDALLYIMMLHVI